jgi:hypothetical protein
VKPSLFMMISFLLGSVIPLIGKIPTERNKLMKALSADMRSIAVDLLDRARKEKETLVDAGLDRSILGALGMCLRLDSHPLTNVSPSSSF